MQLSPLQSRLAASVIASCLVIVLYLVLFAPQFALAADLAAFPSSNLDAHDVFYDIEDTADSFDVQSPSYEPDFSLFDRSIIGRVSDGSTPLDADHPTTSNIDPGSTNFYVFEAASVSGRSAQEHSPPYEFRRHLNGTQEVAGGDGHNELGADLDLQPRQTPSKTLYISVNTCNQPSRISPDQTTMDPPQLTLFVSTSSENTSPGPGKDQGTQKTIVFDEGAVIYNTSLDRDVYFSISAPPVSEKYFSTSLPYNYEVTVSLNGYYHSYNSNVQPNLYLVDSDASSAYLTTLNLTSRSDQILSAPPYTIFVQSAKNQDIDGIRNSYCGLKSWAQIRPLINGDSQATMGLLRGGEANLTMQEFYISGLNASTNYTGIIALNTSLTVQKRQESGSGGGSTGGVVVYRGVPFTTKPNGACTFIFNLTLCTETRYAVPGNLEKFPNGTALAAFYDNYTRTMWDNFDKVLQQTPCQAPPTQRYSLVRDCDDCKQAYKDWLCSVAIPRCEDFSSPDPSLQMRNINASFPNGTFVDESIRKQYGDVKSFISSRNVEIDNNVQPGPYKELLPCDYLCYDLVKSCPASIGFSCPLRNNPFSYNTSYAFPDNGKQLSCNYPGSAYYPSAASTMAVSWASLAAFITLQLFLAS